MLCNDCANDNRFFPNGCMQNITAEHREAVLFGDKECPYFKPDMRPCPKCHKEVLSSEMIWVNDMYGIAYKKVCLSCVEAVKKELQPYPIEEAFGDY